MSRSSEQYRSAWMTAQERTTDLASRHDAIDASEHVQAEQARVSPVDTSLAVPEGKPAGDVLFANALDAIYKELKRIGGPALLECVFVQAYMIANANHKARVVIHFRGWHPAMIPETIMASNVTVIYPIPPIDIDITKPSFVEAFGEALQQLQSLPAYVLTGIHKAEAFDEQTPGGGTTRILRCDVPNVGRLIRRYHKHSESGPWISQELPDSWCDTLTVPIPNQRGMNPSREGSIPHKE